MKANVTVTVKHDGTAKVLVATVGDIADKEFNNRVTPPEEPKFQPEKYVVECREIRISLVTNFVDDDKELARQGTQIQMQTHMRMMHANNEAENINTKTVNRGRQVGLPSMVGYN